MPLKKDPANALATVESLKMCTVQNIVRIFHSTVIFDEVDLQGTMGIVATFISM